MKLVSRIPLAVAVLLAVTAAKAQEGATPTEPTWNIRGSVADPRGVPLPNARVEVRDTGGGLVAYALSDETGQGHPRAAPGPLPRVGNPGGARACPGTNPRGRARRGAPLRPRHADTLDRTADRCHRQPDRGPAGPDRQQRDRHPRSTAPGRGHPVGRRRAEARPGGQRVAERRARAARVALHARRRIGLHQGADRRYPGQRPGRRLQLRHPVDRRDRPDRGRARPAECPVRLGRDRRGHPDIHQARGG